MEIRPTGVFRKLVTYGRAAYEVTAIGMGTEVGKIASLFKKYLGKENSASDQSGRLWKEAFYSDHRFLCDPCSVSVSFRGDQPGDAFLFAVALAVAAIPEALKLYRDYRAVLWNTENGKGACDHP